MKYLPGISHDTHAASELQLRKQNEDACQRSSFYQKSRPIRPGHISFSEGHTTH